MSDTKAKKKCYVFTIFKKKTKTSVIRDVMFTNSRKPKVPDGWYLGNGKKPTGWFFIEQSDAADRSEK